MRFFLVTLLMLTSNLVSFAEDDGQSLEKITQAIAKKENALKDARLNEEKASKQYEELLLRLKDLENKSNLIDLQKKDNVKEQERLSRELNTKEGKYKEMLVRYQGRLRSMYMRSGEALLPSSNNETKFEFFLPYALSVVERDREILELLTKQSDAIKFTRAKINEKGVEIKKLEDQSSEALRLAKDEAKRAEASKRLLLKEREGIYKTLAALKLEAIKVNSVIESITSIEPEVKEPRETPPDAEGPEDIFSTATKLAKPVEGEVLNSFGTKKLESFDDLILTKGMEYTTDSEADVRTIAGGNVAYIGQLPGYGLVVIIDHDNHTHTLYARLSKAKVSLHDTVKKSEVIGSTSVPDAQKRSFYFEVRVNGKPVDPTPLLSRAIN